MNGFDQRKPAGVSPGVSTREEARRQCGTTEKAQVLEANCLSASSAWDTRTLGMSMNVPEPQFPHLQNGGPYQAGSPGCNLSYTIIHGKAPYKG